MFFFLILFFGLIHREFLSELLHWTLRARRTPLPPESDRLRATLRRTPDLYLARESAAEIFVIDRWVRTSFIISESFWESLDATERECLLGWAQSAADRATAFRRLFGFWNMMAADRDTLILCSDGLAFPRLMDKAILHREKYLPTTLGVLLGGLTLLGPSLFRNQIPVKMRVSAYVDQLTRLKK